MKRKPTTILLTLGLALAITACGGSAGAGATSGSGTAASSAGEKKQWVDSDLSDTVTIDPNVRLQDDFAAAVNREWKEEMGDTYYDLLSDVSDAVLEKKKKAVTDESIEGVEAEKLREYYALASDWDLRNSQGVEPLAPYIADIESIGSMDDLYAFFGDLDRNPLALAPVTVSVSSEFSIEKYPDVNLIAIDGPMLSMKDQSGAHYDQLDTTAGLAIYEATQDEAVYMLEKLGYTEAEAKELFRKCLIWEKKVSNSLEEIQFEDLANYATEWDEAVGLAGSFPLDALLRAWGFGGTEPLMISPRNARNLSKLCTQGDLENIKAYLIVNYCLGAAECLDRQTYDTMQEFSKPRIGTSSETTGMSDEQKEDQLQFDRYIGETSMLGALNKVYVENYFNDEVIGELTTLTQEVIDSFKVIFNEEPWLSDEGKALCIEKLESINIHIAYENYEVLDFGKMSFKSGEEGGSFLEAYFAASKYSMYHNVCISKRKYDRDFWNPLGNGTSTTQTNAFYNPLTNGIYICAGICEPSCYAPDMKYEEKLAGLFTVVGHEITHGFDNRGALYDKEGRKNIWLPQADQAAFNDKTGSVSAYYTVLTPYPGSGLYNGTTRTGEATADMGGLRVTLYMASKVPDFDYDLYFRSYARLWRAHYPLEVEESYFAYDVHPLAFYRINVGLQQFDEFYETYGVKEGDGMYLDPQKRIKVW